ncbi:MAG TPA: hypothetical protein VJ184_06120, partial [Chryseolinea sp.]|nr:hypothetical protein [Chryseolinea sp.]
LKLLKAEGKRLKAGGAEELTADSGQLTAWAQDLTVCFLKLLKAEGKRLKAGGCGGACSGQQTADSLGAGLNGLLR